MLIWHPRGISAIERPTYGRMKVGMKEDRDVG
jgi:hypothetical protein